MKNIRIISKLDVKAPCLVKGIQYEGLRKLGDPNEFALKYYKEGIDEILYIDIVASLYDRNSLKNIVYNSTKNIFVPITVGGGIRTMQDAHDILRVGADKIAINTAAIKNPELITQIADQYGSQCMVLSIQAKKQDQNKWEAYYDNGREHTGIDVIEWAKQGYELGAGEILLTSVDRDGTQSGFDVELIRQVSDCVPIPVIACGGMGRLEDFEAVVENGHADAIAIASALHYDKLNVSTIKQYAISKNINVRI